MSLTSAPVIPCSCADGWKPEGWAYCSECYEGRIERLAARITHLTTALSAAAGYLRNADIDLTTGARKATAQRTIQGGLKMVEEALIVPDTTVLPATDNTSGAA